MQLKQSFLFMGGVLLLACMGLGWSMYNTSHPRLMVVDMKKLVNEPAVLLSHSSLTAQEQKRILSAYSQLLPKVLADYGQAHRATLIASTVLYPDSLDVTHVLMDATLERLKHEH